MSDPDHLKARRLVAYCLLLAVAVLMVYSQVGRFEFTNYDDPDYAANNRFVQMGLKWESVQWAIHSTFAWHPLTWLSRILDGQLFGVDPGAHHWFNVGFHVANTLLLFLALLRLTGAAGRSAFVAALIALPPLHVESVAWVAERKDVLSGFLWMLSLLAYARYGKRLGHVQSVHGGCRPVRQGRRSRPASARAGGSTRPEGDRRAQPAAPGALPSGPSLPRGT